MKPKRIVFGRGEGKSSHVIAEMYDVYEQWCNLMIAIYFPNKKYNKAIETRLTGFRFLKGE